STGAPPAEVQSGTGGGGGLVPGAIGRDGGGAARSAQGWRSLSAAGPGGAPGEIGLHAGKRRSGSGADRARAVGAAAGLRRTDSLSGRGDGEDRRGERERTGERGRRREPGLCDLHLWIDRKTEGSDDRTRRTLQLSEVGERELSNR